MYKQFGKRLFDILFTILALCVFTPIIGFIALFVRIKLGRPIFFSQERPGLNEKLFTLLKFRTMTDVYDAHGNVLPDAERLTSFGRFLRTTSLDELPELFNVLRGEMSLVGPRPLLPIYLNLYSPEQARRMDVKPGITGWVQINGRNALDWEKKFELDSWYVDNVSLALDLRILLITFVKVFSKEGISHDNHVTMPGFRGSKDS
jgi:lipopolysaccharide/colanic/teichoic acid biosynthesis glycosyltransferase